MLLVLGIFYISFTALLGQNFQMSEADSLREAGDLRGAIEAGKKRFLENPNDMNNAYNLACSFSLIRQVDSAFHYLKLSLDGDTSVRVLSDPDLLFIAEDERWKEIEDMQVEKVEAKYGKYPNLELSKELWSMSMKDQAYYYHIKLADQQLDRFSPINRALWDLKAKLNEENLSRLEEIIAENGWPKISEVKGSAAQAAFLIVQHSSIEVQEKYLPIMKEAAENGEANWSSLALLIDRVRIRNDKPQLYGSQVRRNSETGAFEPFPIEDEPNVDKRRKEVGLGPLADYLGNWDIKYTVPGK